MRKIEISEWNTFLESQPLIIDIREKKDFENGFIPESVFIPVNKLAKLVPHLYDGHKNILLVGDEKDVEEASNILTGLNAQINVSTINGGFHSYSMSDNPLDMLISIETDEFAMDIQFDANMEIVDVRKSSDFEEEHIVGAISMPIDSMNDIVNVASLDDDKNIYVHCGGGTSAYTASSIFKKHGLHNVRVVESGFEKMAAQEKVDTVKSKSVNK